MKIHNYWSTPEEQIEDISDRYALLLAAILSIIAGVWILDTLMDNHLLPTTDLGQWVMYSRFYNSVPVPSYRAGHGISPFIPILLALGSHFSSNISLAAVFLSAGLYAILLLTAFFTAKRLFRHNLAAILALLLIGYAQYFFAYLISFGGLPQLSAIMFMNTGLIALLQISESKGRKGKLLLLLSALLVVFSHLPSALIFFLMIGIVLIAIAIQQKLDSRTLILITSCTLGIPVVACAAFIAAHFDQEIQYATNEAGFYLRGIDTAFQSFNWNWPFVLVPLLAVLSLLWLSINTMLRKCKNLQTTVTVLWIWFLAPMFFMGVSYLLRVGTDYQRFLYYSVQPPLFALAYQLAHTLIRDWQLFLLNSINQHGLTWLSRLRSAALTITFMIVLATNVRFTVHFYQQAVNYFSPKFGADLLDLITWLSSLEPTTSVLIPSLAEANWVEGISGRATLFPNKFRLLYRPGLEERSLTSDFISMGVSKMVRNGHMLLLFNAPGGIPLDPGIYVYQRGEYYDAITFQDRMITIDIKTFQLSAHLNLMHDFSQMVTTQLADNGSYIIKTSYFCRNPRCGVAASKTVIIAPQSSSVSVQVQVIAKTPTRLERIWISIIDPSERAWSMWEKTLNKSDKAWVDASAEKMTIYRDGEDGQYIAGSLRLLPSPSQITIAHVPVSDETPYLQILYSSVDKSLATIKIEFESNSHWHRNTELIFHDISELIDFYHIGYLVAERSDIRTRTIYDLQYRQVYTNGSYIVYQVNGSIR